MIKLLLLTMLLAVWAPAQGAPDEGHEHPWSQQFQLRQSLQRSTSFGIEVEDGWVKKEVDELTSFYHPNGDGVLKIQSYSAPVISTTIRIAVHSLDNGGL